MTEVAFSIPSPLRLRLAKATSDMTIDGFCFPNLYLVFCVHVQLTACGPGGIGIQPSWSPRSHVTKTSFLAGPLWC